MSAAETRIVAMPWWGTVILTLGAAIVAAASGIGAAVVTTRASRRTTLRDRGSAVLAPVLLFLDEIAPLRQQMHRSSETPKHFVALRVRWEQMREPLIAYAASHPSTDVLPKAEALVRTTWEALVSTSNLVGALTEGMVPRTRNDIDPPPNKLDTARLDHGDARKAADDFLQLIRADRASTWRGELY
jgi:hypothetical protein